MPASKRQSPPGFAANLVTGPTTGFGSPLSPAMGWIAITTLLFWIATHNLSNRMYQLQRTDILPMGKLHCQSLVEYFQHYGHWPTQPKQEQADSHLLLPKMQQPPYTHIELVPATIIYHLPTPKPGPIQQLAFRLSFNSSRQWTCECGYHPPPEGYQFINHHNPTTMSAGLLPSKCQSSPAPFQ